MGRYYGSEALRDPKLPKKAIDDALSKLNPVIQNVCSQAMNQLSTKKRSKKNYKTNRKDIDGVSLREGLNLVKKVINVGQLISETLIPQTKQTFKDYSSGDIARGAFNTEIVYLANIFGHRQKILLCYEEERPDTIFIKTVMLLPKNRINLLIE